jgi:hypothetical protein
VGEWIRFWGRFRPAARRPAIGIGIGLLAAALLISSGYALWIGFRDLFAPVSTAGQLIGLAFCVAGLTGLAGSASLGRLSGPLASPGHWLGRERQATARLTGWIAWAFGGALAGAYADITIVVYAYRYRAFVAIGFGVLALLCLIMAGVLLRPVRMVWGGISGQLKGLAAVGGVLTLVAQFWYASVYIPDNTQAGITYALALGSVVRSGPDTLATLQFTMKNESSLSAVILGSMVQVSALRTSAYADSLACPNFKPSGHDSCRAGPGGRSLAMQMPIKNNAILLPGVTYTADLTVAVPGTSTPVLLVTAMVDSARQNRLLLGHDKLLPAPRSVRRCPKRYVTTWDSPIEESALRRFATGDLHVYSSWCADPDHPFITQTIASPGVAEPSAKESGLQAHYGPYHNSRYETFVLNVAAAAPPARR